MFKIKHYMVFLLNPEYNCEPIISGLDLRDGGSERAEVFCQKRSRPDRRRPLQADARLGPGAASLQRPRHQNIFAGQGKQITQTRFSRGAGERVTNEHTPLIIFSKNLLIKMP